MLFIERRKSPFSIFHFTIFNSLLNNNRTLSPIQHLTKSICEKNDFKEREKSNFDLNKSELENAAVMEVRKGNGEREKVLFELDLI